MNASINAGYSGTPLAKKLGFKPGMRVLLTDMPQAVRDDIARDCAGLIEVSAPPEPFFAAHLFTTERAVLERELPVLMAAMERDGFIWLSWPKKASKVPTDITEDTIREVALPIGLVDVKVCAIDAVWSGLKLMIRKELR